MSFWEKAGKFLAKVVVFAWVIVSVIALCVILGWVCHALSFYFQSGWSLCPLK